MTTNGQKSDDQSSCGSSCLIKTNYWDMQKIINPCPKTPVKYGILILNRPVTQNHEFLKCVWNRASIRMTVDGGTRRWDQYLNNLPEDLRKGFKLPDLVTGDFDSITEEILEKYKKKGCKTIHTPDQDHTDFTKALMELNIHSHALGTELDYALTICQSSGRIDQVLGNIQTLFLARDKKLVNPDTKVFLLSDEALSWLLNPGYHVIAIPEETRKHKRTWCSLVPIGETCESITTTGLKWNLDHQPMKFGHLVSTSNRFDGSESVTIECSHTILWSMRVPSVMHP